MRKRILSVLIAVFMIAVMGVTAFASETPKVVFEVSEVSDNGEFTVDLTIYNATFKGFLGTLGYDPNVVQPAAEEFSEISEVPAKAYELESETEVEDWLLSSGSKIDSEKSKLDLIYILNTKAKSPNTVVSAKFQALASDGGLNVAKLKFKKIADGNIDFKLIENKLTPNGFMLINANGMQSCTVEISYSDGNVTTYNIDGTVETKSSNEGETDEETFKKRVQARSNGTVFLQIDNYATVSDSVLKWVDKDNKAVMPYIKNNYTMVPLRYIAEELNSKVAYNEETQEITIENSRTILVFKVGSVDYTDDGLKKTADVAPEIVNSRTFVPLRTVSEALNRSVEWLEKDRIVVITSKEYPWEIGNKVEDGLLSEIKLMMSPMVRDFAYFSEEK